MHGYEYNKIYKNNTFIVISLKLFYPYQLVWPLFDIWIEIESILDFFFADPTKELFKYRPS